MQKYDSYRIHLCGNLIRLMVHSSMNDHTSTLKACQEAIQFFKAKPYLASVPLQIWHYQQFVCYCQLRDFENGKNTAQAGMKLLEEGAFNWFKYRELLFLLAIHSQNYQESYEIFTETIGHSRFKFLPAPIKEFWKIFEAYLYYLISVRKIKLPVSDKHFTKFRLGRFLNETPIFSKDKRGLNISILVVQIVFMIQQKKYGQAIDRMEAIEKYCSRYLKMNDTFRSNCFIKLLLKERQLDIKLLNVRIYVIPITVLGE